MKAACKPLYYCFNHELYSVPRCLNAGSPGEERCWKLAIHLPVKVGHLTSALQSLSRTREKQTSPIWWSWPKVTRSAKPKCSCYLHIAIFCKENAAPAFVLCFNRWGLWLQLGDSWWAVRGNGNESELCDCSKLWGQVNVWALVSRSSLVFCYVKTSSDTNHWSVEFMKHVWVILNHPEFTAATLRNALGLFLCCFLFWKQITRFSNVSS